MCAAATGLSASDIEILPIGSNAFVADADGVELSVEHVEEQLTGAPATVARLLLLVHSVH